jgi:hypothetical protein
MTLSAEIKASLPIADEFRRDGHDLRRTGSQFVTLCPFHQERTPSCFVNPATGRFHCFGCGFNGTVIDYTVRKRGISPADAMVELAPRVHHNQPAPAGQNAGNGCAKPDVPNRARRLPKLPPMHKGSAADLEQLAKLRNLSIEAPRLASSRGLLWFCRLADGPEKVPAWVMTDRTRRNAQARRLDGERWHHAWNIDTQQWFPVEPPHRRRKVRGFCGNRASWPVGLEEAQPFAGIALVEGVDQLAAFHFLITEGREDAAAPVAMFGATNRFRDDILKLFAGKRIRIFPHIDGNGTGLLAAVAWESKLRSVAMHVDAFDLSGLRMTCGNAVKDLNDLARVDPDCFESEPELRSLMNF